MRKRVEMIISYITDGTDYEYHDNHGVLIRCKDCAYCSTRMNHCVINPGEWLPDGYCSKGERRDG